MKEDVMIADKLKLMLVTHCGKKPFRLYLQFLESCLRGGVTSLQLREKGSGRIFLRRFARKLQRLLNDYPPIPLIINDNVELAFELNAEGVHLGQTDLDTAKAREMLGPNKLIGLSVHSMKQLEKANRLTSINYISVSAVFPSRHKSNLKRICGLGGLEDLVKASNHPVMAIGGINLQNVSTVIGKIAVGVGVIGALHDTASPFLATQNLKKIINETLQNQHSRFIRAASRYPKI